MSVSSVSDPPQSGTRPAASEAPWQAAPEQVVEAYENATEGLDVDEARRRLDEVGPNRLREIEHRSVLEILWEQLKSLVVLLLVVAMGVSFLVGQTIEGLAIVAVLAINTAIGFFTEWRAVRSMEALQKLGEVTARVRRDGQEEIIPADELVPGDVVLVACTSVIEVDGAAPMSAEDREEWHQ